MKKTIISHSVLLLSVLSLQIGVMTSLSFAKEFPPYGSPASGSAKCMGVYKPRRDSQRFPVALTKESGFTYEMSGFKSTYLDGVTDGNIRYKFVGHVSPWNSGDACLTVSNAASIFIGQACSSWSKETGMQLMLNASGLVVDGQTIETIHIICTWVD